MSVKGKNNISSEKQEFYNEIHEITESYRQTAEHTIKVLKDSKDNLEFQKANGLSNEDYLERIKILINMGIIYYFSLYEGFTRIFFRKVAAYDLDIFEDKFDEVYPRLHDIVGLMKTRYKIYIKKDLFEVIMKLKEARDNIAHGLGNAKPEFEIILHCHHIIEHYLGFIHDKMAKTFNHY